MDADTASALVTLATALAQLGVAAAALKVAMGVKAALMELKTITADHNKRIERLEDE